MLKALLGPASVLALAVLAAPASAQARCDRADLDAMSTAYLAAQTTGDSLKLPLADFTQYSEQGEDATMVTGMLSKPQRIDWSRTLHDLASCSTFTELVVADPAHPFVIGTRLQFSGKDNPIAPSRVNEVESIITDPGDRLFDAGQRLQHARPEDWPTIPAAARDSRPVLIAAANAYLDALATRGNVIAWATPCARLENGRYTAGNDAAACSAGLPSGIKATGRHYVVDETLGAVAVLLLAGDGKLPDAHVFRIEHGKVRYVHAITVCRDGACPL